MIISVCKPPVPILLYTKKTIFETIFMNTIPLKVRCSLPGLINDTY